MSRPWMSEWAFAGMARSQSGNALRAGNGRGRCCSSFGSQRNVMRMESSLEAHVAAAPRAGQLRLIRVSKSLLRPTSRAHARRNQEECREETMRHPLLATIGVAFVLAFPHTTRAQGPSALTGLVGSAEEPTMEGVLVSAT